MKNYELPKYHSNKVCKKCSMQLEIERYSECTKCKPSIGIESEFNYMGTSADSVEETDLEDHFDFPFYGDTSDGHII